MKIDNNFIVYERNLFQKHCIKVTEYVNFFKQFKIQRSIE